MSGITYTPKEPREKVKSRITDESRKRMSEGAKRANREGTAETLMDRRLQKYLNDNPLVSRNEFYIRIQNAQDGHRRHFITDSLFVSIDGEKWYEVENVVKKIEGAQSD